MNRRLFILITGAALAFGAAPLSAKTTNATVARPAIADLTCVIVYPVWVLGQQATQQIEACVPTP